MLGDPFLESRETHGPRQPSFKVSARQLGIIVLFTSLSVLFTGTIIAYLVTRFQSPVWRTEQMPPLPIGLIGSTILLGGVSASVESALRNVRKNRPAALNRALWLTGAFAVAFLCGQTFNWIWMGRAQLAAGTRTLYAFTFYMLTGLHALHVVGGFFPLAIVISRARRREYSSSRYEGIKFCAQYWHFLGIVWLVLLTTLYIAT